MIPCDTALLMVLKMGSMEEPMQKFMLLEDRTGSILYKTVMGAFKNAVKRSHSFPAIRGMLFEFQPGGPSDGDNTVNIISCENNDHYLESCPLVQLRLLTEEEFNILRAVSSYHERVDVCTTTLKGGKSKLELGLDAKEGSVVEVYDATGEVKTGIGIIKTIGPIPGSKSKRGTYFGVVLSDDRYDPDSGDQPKITHLPLHRLDFMLGEGKEREDRTEITHCQHSAEKINKDRVKEVLQGGKTSNREGNIRLKESRNSGSHLNSSTLTPKSSKETAKIQSLLSVGTRVVVFVERKHHTNQKIFRGTVKFVGHVTAQSGELFGVELDEKDHAGALGNYYKGTKKLFECKPFHGIIVKPSELMREKDYSPEKSESSKTYASVADSRKSSRNSSRLEEGRNGEEPMETALVKQQEEMFRKLEEQKTASAVRSFPPAPSELMREDYSPEKLESTKPYNSAAENSSINTDEQKELEKAKEPREAEQSKEMFSSSPQCKTTTGFSNLCECPVCFNIFHDPKSLKCEHHFCKDCLGELVQFDEKHIPFIRCPTCNFMHVFESRDSTLESLKFHLFVRQVLDTLLSNAKREDNEPKCCSQPIHWYCVDCTDNLCEKCAQHHQDKGCQKLVTVRYCRNKEAMLPYCTFHQCLRYYGCMTCDSLVCPFCKENRHEGHEVVALNMYAGELREKLQHKILNIRDYNDQLSTMLSEDLTDIVEKRIQVIRRKCDIFLASVEKEIKDKAVLVQRIEHAKWRQKVENNESMVKELESLQKKGAADLFWKTSSLTMAHDAQIDQNIALMACDDVDDQYFNKSYASIRELFDQVIVFPSMNDLGDVSSVAMGDRNDKIGWKSWKS